MSPARQMRVKDVALIPIAKSQALQTSPSQNPARLTRKDSVTFQQQAQIAEKKKLINKRIRKLAGNSLEELVMIDTIQRLGIDHLFQQEIRETLHRQYLEYHSQPCDGNHSHELHEVALRFRLLRQEGYNVSVDAFKNFIDEDKKFKEALARDTNGMLSLYEASYLSIPGEDILDEANCFTKQLLKASLEDLDESWTTLVQNALKHPCHQSLAQLTTKEFLNTLGDEKGWKTELQELAGMEFYMAQNTYQNEIGHFTKWWKELSLAKEVKFARDQPLKWYMWAVAALPDRNFSEQRITITKPVSLLYVIDDIFDVHGRLEDLTLFTQAVNRWEFANPKLPRYMKVCLKALFDVTDEISCRIWLKQGFNPKVSLQKAWVELCNAFLLEAKWLASGQLPAAEEYMKIATVTTGVQMILLHAFFLLIDHIKCNEQDLIYCRRLISSTAMILRLWDDLGSSKDENQTGSDGSYVKCYMNEHDVYIDTAREHTVSMISNAWKQLNEDCLQLPSYPFSSTYDFTRVCLNTVRTIPLMYSYDENHRLPSLTKFIKELNIQSQVVVV